MMIIRTLCVEKTVRESIHENFKKLSVSHVTMDKNLEMFVNSIRNMHRKPLECTMDFESDLAEKSQRKNR